MTGLVERIKLLIAKFRGLSGKQQGLLAACVTGAFGLAARIIVPLLFPDPVASSVVLSDIHMLGFLTDQTFCQSETRDLSGCATIGLTPVAGAQFDYAITASGKKDDEIPIFGTLFHVPNEPVAGLEQFAVWPDGILVPDTDADYRLTGKIWIPAPTEAGDYRLYLYVPNEKGELYASAQSDIFYWPVSEFG